MNKILSLIAIFTLIPLLIFAHSIDFKATKKGKNNIKLENRSTNKEAEYHWDLGDGRVKEATESDIFYFPFKGEYKITLIANDNGKKRYITKNVTIDKDDKNYYKDFELVWSDEFDGYSVNLDDWTFETGSWGWGNNELQNYTDGENAEVKNGNLIITARKTGSFGTQNVGEYTSTRMITKGKQEFLYGRIEMRAKMPKGKGTWAAFWMLGANISEVGWPKCGEIDIMEYVGYDKDIQNGAIHNGSSYGNTINKDKTMIFGMEGGFHTYGVIWDSSSIKFYVDDVKNVFYTYKPDVYNDDTWPHDKPHFLLLNLAIGGNWGGLEGVDDTIFPTDYIIDYVRVYQNPKYD